MADVATVEQGAEDRFLAAWANEQPAVLLNIQRQPGANVIEVADRVQALLPQLTSTMPAAVNVTVLTDRTLSIRASVRDVQKELIFAVCLVILVTFVFLRTIPATIIPSLAVPLSLIGTFAVMLLLDFSVNNLTLMALTIATGFVVDDAIVMLENIARHREQGASPMEAALKGAKEIGFAVVAMTLTLVAVYAPLAFTPGRTGRLFAEFALALAGAVLVSGFVALTLSPMLCSKLLKHNPKPNRFDRGMERALVALTNGYSRVLAASLKVRWLVVLVMVGAWASVKSTVLRIH